KSLPKRRKRDRLAGCGRACDVRGGLLRARKHPAVAHAVRRIDHNDNCGLLIGICRRHQRRKIRSRKRERQKQQRQTTQRKQQQVSDRPPPDRLLLDLLEKHQRGKRLAARSSPSNEVHQHRHPGQNRAKQKKRIQKSHQASSTHLRAPRQIREQSRIQRLRSPQQFVVDSIARRTLSQRIHVRLYPPHVLVSQDVGQDVQLILGLDVFQHDRLVEIKIQLLRVQKMKDDHFIASEAKVFE